VRSVASQKIQIWLSMEHLSREQAAYQLGCTVTQLGLALQSSWMPPVADLCLWQEVTGIDPAEWLSKDEENES